nr:MAG TPA: hypothetical protein [Caudoviricetes sp.]DAQ34465.1 MAG TPA: hypothetical protein [Caudoviricetes sp.]
MKPSFVGRREWAKGRGKPCTGICSEGATHPEAVRFRSRPRILIKNKGRFAQKLGRFVRKIPRFQTQKLWIFAKSSTLR